MQKIENSMKNKTTAIIIAIILLSSELETPSKSTISEKVNGLSANIRSILRRAGCLSELNMVE
jgi:hypothetical protein